MQPTLSTQADIAKNMQPQNMILPTLKKSKKYAAQTPQSTPTAILKQQQLQAHQQQHPQLHSTTQPQFQLNKAYNVVSILKTTTTTTTNVPQATATHMTPPSHHQQQQSYATVVNRQQTLQATTAAAQQQQTKAIICNSGNIMTLNSCQLAAGGGGEIYNHRTQMAATVAGSNSSSSSGNIIDSSVCYISNVADISKGVTNIATQLITTGGGSNIGSSNNNNGSSNSLIALTNTHAGISLGNASAPYIHDKNLFGVGLNVGVGVNVGVSCFDSRKYDYGKNNNLLSNGSFQPAQEYVSSGNSNSGNPRTNPQSGGIFRGPPPTTNAPRGNGAAAGARHVPMPPMYPNVMMPQYPQFGQRQPTFQASHIQYAPAPIPYFPYQYLPTLQQQPPHTRSGVAVNANVNLANSMSVQPGGPNGPLAGPPATTTPITLLTGAVQPGANSVLGGTTSGQVGVPPMVGVLPPNVAPQSVQVQPASRRRHQHRLQIIDPTTKKNILDDLEKNNSNTDKDYQEQQQLHATTVATTAVVQPDIALYMPQTEPVAINEAVGCGMVIPNSKIDLIPAQRQDILVGQTPIVSAMSAAPSVEILPTTQRVKSRKIPIVCPKEEIETSIDLKSVKVDDEANTATKSTLGSSNQQIHIQAQSQAYCVPQQGQQDLSHTQQSQDQLQQQSHTQFMANATAASEEIPVSAVEENESCNETEKLIPELTAPEEVQENVVEIETQTSSNNNFETAQVSMLADSLSGMHLKQKEEAERMAEPTAVILEGAISHESTPDETDRAQITEETTNLIQKETYDNLETKAQLIEMETTKETVIEPEPEPEPETEKQTENEQADSEAETVPTVPIAFESVTPPSLIIYNEGQWSPCNPSGKKQYNREQLMQLREAKASRVQPEVKNVSILPHPNMMPLFMRNNNNNNNKRVQSMVGMIGGNRNSESGNNFVGKQVSMSGVQAGRSSMKGMIHVNLSLNQDVKLNENENAWRPRMQSSKADDTSDVRTTHEKDDLVRRVRGILNKLTPERFDTLVEEIIKLKIDTIDKMNDVIVLVFEKAIDEPNFSVSYARLCHRLISEVKARDERMEIGTKSNLHHFRTALLDKTEREFTQNVSQSTAKEIKLQPIVDNIKKCTDPNEKAELEALLEEEERKIRRRSGGTVRFIGELFKISMLTGKIIYSCIDTLLNPHSEDMLECLCKLLTTVGAKFEQTRINTKEPSRFYSLEKCIARMQLIASKSDKDGAKVSSRVRFMLQDVIDLRKNKWQSTRNEAPKTMGQIEKEAKNEQLSAQYMNYSGSLSTSNPNGTQSGRTGKREDRSGSRYGDNRSTGYGGSHSQRGDNMRHQQQNTGNNAGSGSGGNITHSNGNNDDTWHVQTSKGSRSQAVDGEKLEGLTLLNKNFDNKKMGGLDQFLWNMQHANEQSSTPTTTPSNSFAALSSLDKSTSDRNDRNGPRNKGSYNKGSMERDRYGDRGMHSRNNSQGSRENSTSRVGQQQHQQSRGMINTSIQKSASHSKYTQPQVPPARLSNKTLGPTAGSSAANVGGLYRSSDQPQSTTTPTSASASTTATQPAAKAIYLEPSDSDIKLFKTVLTDLAETTKTVNATAIECIRRIPEQQRCGLICYILTDYLHLRDVGKQHRRYLANSIAYLIQQNYLSVDHFKLAYNKFSECAMDIIHDVPELWLYVLQFAGPLIVKKVLTVSDLWNKNMLDNDDSGMGKKFLKTYLTYCTREVGPNFTRNMWKTFDMSWSDYMLDNEVADFIKSNRLEYVQEESKPPVIEEREPAEKHIKNVIEQIEHLLKEGATADCIIDYSNGNIVVADKLFIRGLATTLSNFAIVYKENSYKLESEVFQKLCIPVLHRYIDSNKDLQLECLYGVQLLVNDLEHPRGLMSELFCELYDSYVIQRETLLKWRDSKDQSAGKGVAVKSLNPFFNSLIE